MKTIKNARYAVFCLIIIILEMTVCKYMEIGGAVPMLAFCFCITFSLFENDLGYICFVPALLGALLDVLAGHGFGTYTLLFSVSTVLAFFVRDKLFSSRIILLIFEVFFLSVGTLVFYYLIHIIDIKGNFLDLLTSVIFPTAVYNIVVSLVIYPAVKGILFKRR